MRITVHTAILASILAVLLAFATTPAFAQMTRDLPTQESEILGGQTGKELGEVEKGFAGEAKAGATQEEEARGEMKSRFKTEEKADISQEPKARVTGEVESKAKTEAEREKARTETKAGMKGEERTEVAPEPKAKVSGELEGKAGREAEKEVGKKPEARDLGERQPAMTERRDIGVKKEGAMRTEAQGEVKGGEALVMSVDRPEGCLRIRSDPSAASDIIACAAERDTLILTGVFSENGRWAQLDNNGWVFVQQIQTDVRPSTSMASEREWERQAAAGEGKKGAKRAPHSYHGGACYFYPGYYHWYPGYYWYPGYFY
jgi:hypothetical protein